MIWNVTNTAGPLTYYADDQGTATSNHYNVTYATEAPTRKSDDSWSYDCRTYYDDICDQEIPFSPSASVRDAHTARTKPTLTDFATKRFNTLLLCPMIRAPGPGDLNSSSIFLYTTISMRCGSIKSGTWALRGKSEGAAECGEGRRIR